MFGEHTDEIKYHLPVSCVHVSGSITHSHDTILDKTESTPQAAIALDVIAGSPELTAKIESGLLRDTSVAFELTDDGRLVSSSVESTGEAGKTLLGVVTVGGAIAGAVVGLPPGAVGGALAVAAGLVARDGRDHRTLIEEARKPDAEKDAVAKAYEEAYPHVLASKERYATLVSQLGESLAQAVEDLNAARNEESRRKALMRTRSLRQGLELARTESERLDAHFKAWRATTLKTWVEQHEKLLILDALLTADPTVENGELKLGAPNSPEGVAVKKIWDTLGVVVVAEPAAGDSTSATAQAPAQAGENNRILVRIPRRLSLALYKKGDPGTGHEGKPVLVESRSYLVMDTRCELETVNFRKSLWAKRGKTLKFSSSGALTGFSSTATSAGAAFAEAAQGAPTAFSGGLEQSKKIYEELAALRDRSLDERLARIKKEVELKQQEIAQAGLLATEGSAAELERLKQEAEILEKRKTIAGYETPPDGVAAELAGIKQQIELLSAKQALAAAQRELTSDAELGEIWQEIERLRTQRELDDVRKH